jgi:hypothetical protein
MEGFPFGGDPEDLMRSLREFAEQQAETVQEAQREQFATLTLNTAVELTAATVVKRLNTKGAIDTTKYALPPIDYTKPAIPKDKVLSTLRIFTHYTSNWRFDNKGIPHTITNGWTDIFHKVKVTGA